jgi:hypothetical protein
MTSCAQAALDSAIAVPTATADMKARRPNLKFLIIVFPRLNKKRPRSPVAYLGGKLNSLQDERS